MPSVVSIHTATLPVITPIKSAFIDASNYFGIKMAYSFVIMFTALFFGLLPMCFIDNALSICFLNYINSFTKGLCSIFGFCYLLPIARNYFIQYDFVTSSKSSIYGWPLCIILAIFSYFFIGYLIELSTYISDKKELTENNYLNEPLLMGNDNNNHSNNNSIITKSYFIGDYKITPFILLISLIIHSVLEEISLGIINNSRQNYVTFLAILLRKWAVSYALGTSFYKMGTKNSVLIVIIFIFSIFSPAGVYTGIYFSEDGYLIVGVLLSISAGIYLNFTGSELIFVALRIIRDHSLCFLLGAILGLYLVFQQYDNVKMIKA